MSRKEDLMKLGLTKPMELVAEAKKVGVVNLLQYEILEELVDAIISAEGTEELPAYLRGNKPVVGSGLWGLLEKLIEVVHDFRQFFTEHQLEYEVVQNVLMSRYTTEDEVRRIMGEELEKFRAELGQELGPALQRLKTTTVVEPDEPGLIQSAIDWLNKPWFFKPVASGKKPKM